MSHILLTRDGAVATITLNRPDKLNAMFGTMREDLVAAIEECGNDDAVRAVIVTGAGRAFCSGGDVEYMAGLQKNGGTEEFRKLLEAGRKIVTSIRRIPKLVIAAVNGVAAGAGCNLALACDYRIASERAKFSESFVRIGLHPDWGGTFFLPRLVGTARALEMLTSGRMVEAEEALRIGLVEQVTSDDRLADTALTLARRIAEGPPRPIGDIKAAVYGSFSRSLEEQIDVESENQLRAFLSRDSAEGMAAFFEKRKPAFRGE